MEYPKDIGDLCMTILEDLERQMNSMYIKEQHKREKSEIIYNKGKKGRTLQKQDIRYYEPCVSSTGSGDKKGQHKVDIVDMDIFQSHYGYTYPYMKKGDKKLTGKRQQKTDENSRFNGIKEYKISNLKSNLRTGLRNRIHMKAPNGILEEEQIVEYEYKVTDVDLGSWRDEGYWRDSEDGLKVKDVNKTRRPLKGMFYKKLIIKTMVIHVFSIHYKRFMKGLGCMTKG